MNLNNKTLVQVAGKLDEALKEQNTILAKQVSSAESTNWLLFFLIAGPAGVGSAVTGIFWFFAAVLAIVAVWALASHWKVLLKVTAALGWPFLIVAASTAYPTHSIMPGIIFVVCFFGNFWIIAQLGKGTK